MAAKDLNTNTLQMADNFGFQLVNELKAELFKAGKDASGTVIKTMRHNVKAEDYFRYIDKGRRPGSKMPPVEPIVKWLKLRGIDEKLQFPIRRKIAERGIKALNILAPTVRKVTVEFLPNYGKEMAHLIGVRMSNDVFSRTNTQGRIIPKGFL
mgnify:CR=1 FL=1